tara:strand:+ start:204 stop:548 length:345 start_codon:yes stop_codon:yes gene_type:complete
VAEREKETTSRQLTEDELVEYARKLFDGKILSYWQMKSPPSTKEMEMGFSINTENFCEQRREDYKRRSYWKDRALKLLKDPRSKRNDLETAEIGTRWNKKLNAEVKDRIKQTKK